MTPLAAWLAALCRLYILVALVAAVAGKAADLGFFRETLAKMFRLGNRAAGAASLAVVGVEAAIALALVAAPRPGMMAALALFASSGWSSCSRWRGGGRSSAIASAAAPARSPASISSATAPWSRPAASSCWRRPRPPRSRPPPGCC